MGNKTLERARQVKNDEFYTKYEDIAAELPHYKEFLKGKKVYCNCDDPRWSNFWKYLHEHFAEYELKELIATFKPRIEEPAFAAFYKGGNDADITYYERKDLIGGGSFDSEECVEILKSIDVLITNPPFSIANKRFLPTLLESEKDFIIVGDNAWTSLKTIFRKVINREIRIGWNQIKDFITENGETKQLFPKNWYTNLPIEKNTPPMSLTKAYYGNENKYPHYDNYDAIEVSRIENIPGDYYGMMGVPITFLLKWNPDQFEVLNITQRNGDHMKTKKYTKDDYENYSDLNAQAVIIIDGKPKALFRRCLIKRKQCL